MNTSTAVKAIGWLGLGLGAAELVVPGWLQRQLGAENYGRLMRIFGVRELLAGIGGNSADTQAWSRNACESLDLMTIAGALQRRMQAGHVATTLAALAALTALDALVERGREAVAEPRLAPRQKEAKAAARPRPASRRGAAKAAASAH